MGIFHSKQKKQKTLIINTVTPKNTITPKNTDYNIVHNEDNKAIPKILDDDKIHTNHSATDEIDLRTTVKKNYGTNYSDYTNYVTYDSSAVFTLFS
jgi:hypothetical protein